MKIVHPLLEIPVILEENIINTIVVENQTAFSMMIGELVNQTKDKEGQFVLSDGLKQLSIASSCELILEPFSLDLNQRKIISRLYSRLKDTTVESDFYVSTRELVSHIISYTDKITQTVDYPLEYSSDIDMASVFKLVDLRLEENHETLLEKILNYLSVVQEFINISVFVFVNIKSFLLDKDLQELFKAASYKKYKILLFESISREKFCDAEKIYIIDSDLCSIY